MQPFLDFAETLLVCIGDSDSLNRKLTTFKTILISLFVGTILYLQCSVLPV